MIDIPELSAILKDIILDHDEVALPGIGMFLAENVPASFADNGYSINPPGRKLTFIQRLGADTLLIDRYCRNAENKDEARAELLSSLMELNRKLKAEKSILLPGLGLLRATDENLFFFVPEEHMDICPESFGLEKVYLKAAGVEDAAEIALEETPAVEAPAVEVPAEEPAVEEVPVEEPVVEEVPAEEPAIEEMQDEDQTIEDDEYPISDMFAERRPGKWFYAFRFLIGMLIVAMILMLLLAVLGRIAPNLIDRLLYTPEEIEVLRYEL